ncbi:MAG: nucleotidyltransferase family protein [Verrucomicrobia bacterium]|nr:nucleotidyltransferase family protein [Verrucomicrobiota bacterium]MBU4365744.1 nucleotidyltransferase family protein [Verrucomicrobiota bacterium]
MQAIILLGGKGTRLQGLYPDLPKALAPIAGRPFLEWQLEWLERHGIRDAHLAAGHLARTIRDWASTAGRGNTITVSAEPAPLGTGGGLKFTEPFIRTDPFLILNGDSLLPNLDLHALADAGQTPGTLITLAITRIESAGRYGTVEFDARKRVTAFREKDAHTGGWINGGVYLARRTLLARIEPDKTASLETDVFPALCAENQLGVFLSEPPLLDMGTPDGIQAMERYLRNPATNLV